MARRRWMLTGALGNLGWAIRQWWPQFFPDDDLIQVSRDTVILPDGQNIAWNLSDISQISDLIDLVRPDIALHGAAMSDPALCEADPQGALLVNRDITEQLAIHVRRCSGWMLYCSTDFVFAGDAQGPRAETDATAPQTVYGKSKLAGEEALLAQDCGLVARLSLMFDPVKPNSRNTWARIRANLQANADLFGVIDEWRTPIAFTDAAQILLTLARQERRGIVHVGGARTMSPYDLIMHLRAQMGSCSNVKPVLGKDASPGFPRPRNAALATDKLNRWLAAEAPDSLPVPADRDTLQH